MDKLLVYSPMILRTGPVHKPRSFCPLLLFDEFNLHDTIYRVGRTPYRFHSLL